MLREEDVTQTLYRETLKSSERDKKQPETNKDLVTIYPSQDDGSTKVNRVCDAILEELNKNPTDHLQNIVTANMCKSPPDYEGGLQVVANLQSRGFPHILPNTILTAQRKRRRFSREGCRAHLLSGRC